MYYKRQVTPLLQRSVEQFPIVFLTGPRQSGKTTLLKKHFQLFRYVNLEDPEIRQWAIDQPKDFLYNNKWPLIIDEAQYAPDLFSYIQLIVDEQNKTGMYILTGSQNFLLMHSISQTLAGRTSIINLLPFSYKEIKQDYAQNDTNSLIFKGFYPRLYQTVSDSSLFYKSYINTYVEKDVRQLSNISNSNNFIRFIRLCAGRCGQLLNVNSLASETGISYKTCNAWISYLAAGFVIQLISPYHRNFNKRIIKSPKLYFTDTGLLCYLLGIDSTESLALHHLRGSIFENLIFIELLKNHWNKGIESGLWFWRDNHGTEIDFIIEKGLTTTAIEVKSGGKFHKEYLANLKKFLNYSSSNIVPYLVYDGEMERSIDGIKLINWKNCTDIKAI